MPTRIEDRSRLLLYRWAQVVHLSLAPESDVEGDGVNDGGLVRDAKVGVGTVGGEADHGSGRHRAVRGQGQVEVFRPEWLPAEGRGDSLRLGLRGRRVSMRRRRRRT